MLDLSALYRLSPLARALELQARPGRALMAAFTGSGGKTTCCEQLARDAVAAGYRTVLTTTTKMRVPPHCLDPHGVADVAKALDGATEPLILGRVADDGRKLLGPPVALLEELASTRACDLIVIEADGSRGASIKGYREGEPIVPRGTDRVVVLVGVDAMGAGREDPLVHRSEILWPFLELGDDERLDAAAIARALLEQPGYFDRLNGAPAAILINKVDDGETTMRGRRLRRGLRAGMTRGLHSDCVDRLLWRGKAVDGGVAPLWIRSQPRTCGILLAAGRSERFGGHKLTAPLDGVPLVGYAVRAAVDSLLDERHLVVGFDGRAVAAAAECAAAESGLGEPLVNERYDEGMASSMQCGIEAVAETCAGVLVMLADMPAIGPALVNRVLRAAHRHADRIVLPVCEGRRGHPVYFARRFFPELLALRGDVGGAAVVRAHGEAVVEVEVPDVAIFDDVDRPSDVRPHPGGGPEWMPPGPCRTP